MPECMLLQWRPPSVRAGTFRCGLLWKERTDFFQRILPFRMPVLYLKVSSQLPWHTPSNIAIPSSTHPSDLHLTGCSVGRFGNRSILPQWKRLLADLSAVTILPLFVLLIVSPRPQSGELTQLRSP